MLPNHTTTALPGPLHGGWLAADARVAAAAAGLVAVAVLLFAPDLLFASLALRRFPVGGQEHGNYYKRLLAFRSQAEKVYLDSYRRFQNSVWRMQTLDGERLMLGPKYLEELRHLPDSVINSNKALFQELESHYTGLPSEDPFLNHMIRADLTRNLNRIIPRLSEQVDRAVQTELPAITPTTWTAVAMYPALLRIVAIISGSIFLGPDLCRREEYLHASIHFTVDLFGAVRELKRWPGFLRALAVWFTPAVRGIDAHRREAKRFLLPVIRERRRLAREAAAAELPDDMLQWMVAKAESQGGVDDDTLALRQLTLSMAAIHTTSMTALHVLYDLAARPEVIVELRDEIRGVLASTGGAFTAHALYEMKLLDSVLRESQRINTGDCVRFTRYVETPFTLQDGTTIPAGAMLQVPHIAIMRDPANYPDPETWDPHRFLRLRTGATPDPIGYKSPEQYQFVTVTKENVSFGYGRHACPGRFFAASEIKLVVARLLLEFDVAMPGGRAERYPNVVTSSRSLPDVTRELVLRRVGGV